MEFHLFGSCSLAEQLRKMGVGEGGCSDDLRHQKTKQGRFLHDTKKQASIKLSFLPPP